MREIKVNKILRRTYYSLITKSTKHSDLCSFDSSARVSVEFEDEEGNLYRADLPYQERRVGTKLRVEKQRLSAYLSYGDVVPELEDSAGNTFVIDLSK